MKRFAARSRIALIGHGRWGRHILRDLLALGCRAAVVDHGDGNRASALSAGADSAVAEIEDLPGRIDGVVIAVPATVHVAAIERALPFGVPIFVEKPLSTNEAEARRIARLAGGRLHVMEKWRYHPGIVELARMARSSELGAVRALRLRRIGWGHHYEDCDAVWTLLPHDLSIAQEILGPLRGPVFATGVNGADGRPAEMLIVLGEKPSVTIEVSALRPVRERSVTLICESGTACLPDAYASAILVVRPTETEPQPRAIAQTMPLYEELRVFVAHLNGGPAPKGSIGQSLDAIRIVGLARRLAGWPEDTATVNVPSAPEGRR